MSMASCRECSADVSTTARTCTTCGVKHPALGPDAVKARAAASLAYNAGCIIVIVLGTMLALGFILALVL